MSSDLVKKGVNLLGHVGLNNHWNFYTFMRMII